MVAWRRGRAFCKGIVITARRGGLPFAPAKGSKTGQRGTKLSPLQTPLTLSCGWIRTMQGIVRTAHRYAPKVAAGAFLSPPRWSAEGRTTTPVPSSKEGDYGAGKQILSNLRLARCKAADPWLWLAGLSVCRKREGVPLPRSGGGWEGADAPRHLISTV